MNEMRRIKIGKVTLNIGVGEPGGKLEKAYNLLEKLTGRKPVKTTSHKRIPEWDVRPGLQVGVKVTLREDFNELLDRLLSAKDYTLKRSCFDKNGNLNFGVDEYVHIPGLKYEPEMPMFGLNVVLTLERPGYSIKRRRINPKKVGKKQLVNQEEGIRFMKREYDVSVK